MIKWFPGKVRDIRVERILMSNTVTQASMRKHYDISFLPKLKMWFYDAGTFPVTSTLSSCARGLDLTFMYWTVEIFEYHYRKPYREPWIEDHEQHYVETVRQHNINKAPGK
jgi:hypothetical protein